MATILLANKVVCITGASRGIGRACALACARHGATGLVLHYFGDEATTREVESLKREIEDLHAHSKVVYVPGDIALRETSLKVAIDPHPPFWIMRARRKDTHMMPQVVGEGVKAFNRIGTHHDRIRAGTQIYDGADRRRLTQMFLSATRASARSPSFSLCHPRRGSGRAELTSMDHST